MSVKHCKTIQMKAERLANELNQSKTKVGKGDRGFYIKGVDPNEVKKVYSYFCRYNNLKKLEELLNRLPNSSMCRTNKTTGYYINIQNTLRKEGIFRLSVQDANAVLGWACRLL